MSKITPIQYSKYTFGVHIPVRVRMFAFLNNKDFIGSPVHLSNLGKYNRKDIDFF